MTITREQIEMYASAADATQTFEMDKGKLIAVEPEHMQELARIALASLELERGKIRRYDLDMSDCDSCGQDCGADMVEDLDGEYVLWDEVLPYLYRHDEYAAPPAPVVPEEVARAIEGLKQTLVNCNRYNYCSDAVKRVENACRAAMQGKAEPVSQPYKLPNGWVVVPIEPTVDMRKAFHKANDACEQYVSPDHQWEAMLAAAPQQEAE